MRETLMDKLRERFRQRMREWFWGPIEVDPRPEPIILPDDPVDDED